MANPVLLDEGGAHLTREHDCSQAEAKRMRGSALPVLPAPMTEGKMVRLPELARASVVDVSERQVRHPATCKVRTAAATRQARSAVPEPFKAVLKKGSV